MDAADREIVDSHVEQCVICRNELRDLQEFTAAPEESAVVRRVAFNASSPEHPDILARASESRRPHKGGNALEQEEALWWKLSHFWRFPGYLVGAATAAVIVFGAVLSTSSLLHRAAPPTSARSTQGGGPPVSTEPQSHSAGQPLGTPVAISARDEKLETPAELAPLIGTQGTLM